MLEYRAMYKLTERQNIILRSVVETHIETAQPVGSRAVIDRGNLQASSATVRSELGYLGEVGYLNQVHISSGRVPTDTGYRYYVNCLMNVQNRSGFDAEMADALFAISQRVEEADDFVEQATEFLSRLTQQTSMICAVNPHNTLVRYARLGIRNSKIYLQGTSCILDQPEFQDIQKAKPVLRAFDEKNELIKCFDDEVEEERITIKIGQENRPCAFHDCTVIAKRYYVSGENAGTIAVVGPKRISYMFAVPVVSRMAEMVGAILGNYY